MAMTTYEFRVDGRLSEEAREAFCDMRVEQQEGRATLYGEIIDESHLVGVLSQFGVLGLVVVSAHPVATSTVRLPAETRRPSSGGRSAGSPVVDDHLPGRFSGGG